MAKRRFISITEKQADDILATYPDMKLKKYELAFNSGYCIKMPSGRCAFTVREFNGYQKDGFEPIEKLNKRKRLLNHVDKEVLDRIKTINFESAKISKCIDPKMPVPNDMVELISSVDLMKDVVSMAMDKIKVAVKEIQNIIMDK